MPPKPKAFSSAAAFRRWLEKKHASEKELVIRLFKTSAKHRGMGYAEALDEALCFGWIDGVRRSHDGDSFTTRFTPRRPKSRWSRVNIRHMERLVAAGRVHSAGAAAFNRRGATATAPYSFESEAVELDAAGAKRFRANKKAWAFFNQQAPWYRRVSKFFVMSAKRPETRAKRLSLLIDYSARGERIPPLAPRPGK